MCHMDTNTHHAMSIEAERTEGLVWAHTFIHETFGLQIQGNPDIELTETERFTIEHARQLKTRATQSPLGSAQVFIIVCESILHEAQNALLKLFEEPSPQTYFILVIPTHKGLLPTVRSRLAYMGRIACTPQEVPFATSFLQASVGERLALLQPTLKKKDRAFARAFVNALEHHVHKKGLKNHAQALAEIAYVRNYLPDRSSSLKMLLEHLAVTLPK